MERPLLTRCASCGHGSELWIFLVSSMNNISSVAHKKFDDRLTNFVVDMMMMSSTTMMSTWRMNNEHSTLYTLY